MKTRSGRKAKAGLETENFAAVSAKPKPPLHLGRPEARRRKRRREQRELHDRLPPLRLALVPVLILAGLSLLPRVNANPWLLGSFWGATAVLLVLRFLLRRQVERTGREVTYEFVPVRVHYVQAMMQACVYAYWGWYWPPVYGHVPHIARQIAFVYALDMLVCWFRREKWVLGFGPFPIVFSTNLFMWFRDDWFFLQFAMVATGVLGKEFVRWTREGRLTHIFNPSALSLFLFSVVLIATNSTGITWGPEIAASISLPPRMYLEIFLVGLVVQALFSVTLVTLSAAAALYALNLAYTGSTGTYHFVITNIPVAVFLGLHLLVTDPATSPRTTLGKIVFGAMYGVSSFGLFGLLDWMGLPTFYDKLLCVPVLNLTVPALDRMSRALASRFRLLDAEWAWNPQRFNLAFMSVWVALFVTMMATGFLGAQHPGRDRTFWRRACDDGLRNGCRTWVKFLEGSCRGDVAASCNTLGRVLNEGRVVPRNQLQAGKHLVRACELGLRDGCTRLKEFVRDDGRNVFDQACAAGDSASCLMLGELHHYGLGVPRDDSAALELFRRSCSSGWPRGCGRLGESYLGGEGTTVDPVKAIENFERACDGGHALGCATAAKMYRDGVGGLQNESLAGRRLSEACKLGLEAACQPGERPAASKIDPTIEILKMGG